MYFRSLGTKYRSASPRLTARTVLFTIWLGLVPKHSQSIFHSYFGLNKHKTDPKNRSQRCFGSVGATEPCTVWVVCAVARNTFHKRNFTESNPAFQYKKPESARVDNAMSSATAVSFWPRKWVFDPQGPGFPRPNGLVYHFYLGSGTQNTAFVIFSVLSSAHRNTRLRSKETNVSQRCFGSKWWFHDAMDGRAVACNTSIENWIYSSDNQQFIRPSMNLESRITAVK